jgi:hypothetical protein
MASCLCFRMILDRPEGAAVTRHVLYTLLLLSLAPSFVHADPPEDPVIRLVRLARQPERAAVDEVLPRARQPLGPELIRNIDPRSFDSISTDLEPASGLMPTDQATEVFQPGPLSPEGVTWKPFYWSASEIWHRPLYFDDVQLERYGQTRAPLLQPVLSGAHFFGTLPIIPYKTGLDRPFEMVSTLGYYRPGSPAPCVGRRLPWQWDAALIQAGAVVSGVFILP